MRYVRKMGSRVMMDLVSMVFSGMFCCWSDEMFMVRVNIEFDLVMMSGYRKLF